MSPRSELKRLINPRAEFLARGQTEPTSAAPIVLRLMLVIGLLGLSAVLLTQLFAAI
jgi:hypothetical protein